MLSVDLFTPGSRVRAMDSDWDRQGKYLQRKKLQRKPPPTEVNRKTRLQFVVEHTHWEGKYFKFWFLLAVPRDRTRKLRVVDAARLAPISCFFRPAGLHSPSITRLLQSDFYSNFSKQLSYLMRLFHIARPRRKYHCKSQHRNIFWHVLPSSGNTRSRFSTGYELQKTDRFLEAKIPETFQSSAIISNTGFSTEIKCFSRKIRTRCKPIWQLHKITNDK